MNDLLYSILLIICFIGGGALASLFWLYRVEVWRIRWIEMEHDLARALKREPRDIESL